MKKILLLLLLFFSCTISFAQQSEKKTIHVTTGSHLKKFLKNSANQKLAIIPTPFTGKEYPRQITLSDSLRQGLLRKEMQPIITNSIPVWSPGSDYVFNMPGTFPYNKNQVRVHVPRYVTVVKHQKDGTSEKNSTPTKE